MTFAEKIRTIGVLRRRGNSITKPVRDEKTGNIAGKEIEHWDGSQDAVVRVDSIQYKLGRKHE